MGADASSDAPRNSDLPAPPDDSCERFQIREGACVATGCPPWPCELYPWANDRWCHSDPRVPHCIVSLDCQAVGAPDTKQAVLACLERYQPCTVDADCPDGFCVIDARHAKGSCEEGLSHSRCRVDTDCRAGNRCIAIQADGRRGCADGAEGTLCNIDSDCQSNRCVHQPGQPILGMCSSGKPGAPCVSQASCPPDAPCPTVQVEEVCEPDAYCVSDVGGARCSAGNLGEPCSEDNDCKSGHCPRGIAGGCTAGAVGEPCLDAADCETGFCGPNSKQFNDGLHCTSGEAGEGCREGADCKSTSCDRAPADSPFWSVCVARLRSTGEICSENTHCQSGVCGQNSLGKVCVNGQLGDACGEAVECASGFCVPFPMLGFQCGSGALADRCLKDADCVSQRCVVDAGQGFAVCAP